MQEKHQVNSEIIFNVASPALFFFVLFLSTFHYPSSSMLFYTLWNSSAKNGIFCVCWGHSLLTVLSQCVFCTCVTRQLKRALAPLLAPSSERRTVLWWLDCVFSKDFCSINWAFTMYVVGAFCFCFVVWGVVFFLCFQFLCDTPGPCNVVLPARAKLSFVCTGFIK